MWGRTTGGVLVHTLNTPLGDGRLSRLLRARGCRTLDDASRLLIALPYGRPVATGIDAVLAEGRGTCSGKHALFVEICREAGVPARLLVGFFLMTEANTPGVGPVLAEAGLDGIWEAHCIAGLPEEMVDLTGLPGGAAVVLQAQIEIEPDAIADKPALHRVALGRWAADSAIPLSVDTLWSIRERCIAALARA